MKLQEFFSTKDTWIKGHSAATKSGWPTFINNIIASKWCILGGIIRCYPPDKREDIIQKVINYTGYENITQWNDNYTTKFEDVKELIKTLDI